ncbi:MAG: dihydropteroate synthase [bacterium]
MGFKDTFFSRNLSINCRGNLLDLSNPKIMGILNVTPDSFYDGGKYTVETTIRDRVKEIVDQGADIIDVGAFSSRPGAAYISMQEELERLIPALEIIKDIYPEIPVSVDTFRSDIARKITGNYGVDIINDITAGEEDPEMFEFIAESNIPYIMMHMKGKPEIMQKDPQYKDVVNEVLTFLEKRVDILLNRGVNDVIIDPGFGFGKSMQHNYTLLSGLEVFRALEVPILIGISRKSMTYKFLGTGPGSALNGTSALHMYALLRGANILRVHDVKEAVEVKKLFEKLIEEEKKA